MESRIVHLNEDLCNRREYKNTNNTGNIHFVNYFQIVFVAVLMGVFVFCVFFVLFLCFRSRSYPVPHRGERVKQRMVHA
jgi:site-specific recombinase